MRRRHTRKTDPDLYGPSIQRAIRLPEVQLQAVQATIAQGTPDIHSVTDAIIDALWLWLYENSRANGVAAPPPVEEPVEAAEPTEADRLYTGTHQRPSWSDVDASALDG